MIRLQRLPGNLTLRPHTVTLPQVLDCLATPLTAESIIKTGKYKDKSFAEVALDDPNYIDWFLANTKERIDYDSFYKLKQR